MKKLILFLFMLLPVLILHAQSLRPEQYASSVIAFSSQYGTTNYSAARALGRPDVFPACGNNINAWTSATENGQREFLVLGFSSPQPVNTIRIYQNVAPGAIDTVFLRDASTGSWHEVYSTTAAAPGDGTSCPGDQYMLLEISIATTSYNVDAIRIAINSPAVTNYWNEIDAVGIANFDEMPGSTVEYANEVIDFSSEYQASPQDWSAAKALGTPDVTGGGCGTNAGAWPNAWASETRNGQREYLVLGYANAAHVNRVMIHQVTAPGAVDTVYLREAGTNTWHTVYTATAASLPCPSGKYLEINFTKTTYLVDAVRIAINSPVVNSYWNEIDAVGLRTDHLALPVTFGSISANLKGNLLTVNWESLAETNNHHYEIEISEDGQSFTKTGTMDSKALNGNSTGRLQYRFQKNLNGGLVAGVILLSLITGTFTRRMRSRILLTLSVIISSLIITVGCHKQSSEVETVNNNKLMVRIAQVDIDGTRKLSKAVQAIRE